MQNAVDAEQIVKETMDTYAQACVHTNKQLYGSMISRLVFSKENGNLYLEVMRWSKC